MGPVIIKNLSLSDLGSNSYGLGLNYGQPHPRSNRSVYVLSAWIDIQCYCDDFWILSTWFALM